MSDILTVEQVAEIAARYEAFAWKDPDCTCRRTDVDFYDNSDCDLCGPRSEYVVAYRHAKYMLDIHGAQDIEGLRGSHEALRAENERLAAELKLTNAQDDYVAWMRYQSGENGRTRILVCDSNDPKAFRVWRRPNAAALAAITALQQVGKIRDERDAAIAERDRQSRMVTALADTLDTTEGERDGLRRAIEAVIKDLSERAEHTSGYKDGLQRAVFLIRLHALAAVPAPAPLPK